VQHACALIATIRRSRHLPWSVAISLGLLVWRNTREWHTNKEDARVEGSGWSQVRRIIRRDGKSSSIRFAGRSGS